MDHFFSDDTVPFRNSDSETVESLSKKLLDVSIDPLEYISRIRSPESSSNPEEDDCSTESYLLPAIEEEEQLDETDILTFFEKDTNKNIETVIVNPREEVNLDPKVDPSEYNHVFDLDYLRDFDSLVLESDLADAFGSLGLEETTFQKYHHNQFPISDFQQFCQPCNLDLEEALHNIFEDPFDKLAGLIFDSVDFDTWNFQDTERDLENTFNDFEFQSLLENMSRNSSEVPSNDLPQSSTFSATTTRNEVFRAAEPLLRDRLDTLERQCFGHKGTIFGVAISPCGQLCATASQDSTVCIWDISKNSLRSTIHGNNNYEFLRVAWASRKWASSEESGFSRSEQDLVLATSGSDGLVKIWQSFDNGLSWKSCCTVDHLNSCVKGNQITDDFITVEGMEDGPTSADDEASTNGTEIYALQFIDSWSGLPLYRSKTSSLISSDILMTSAEDFVYVWQHVPLKNGEHSNLNMKKILSLHFTHLEYGFGGVFVHIDVDNSHQVSPVLLKDNDTNIVTNTQPFGGSRNPDNLVFVFDAAQCPANDLLGVALSDGTLRLLNGRGVCVTLLQLPGSRSHLTSFAWDKTGKRLASCVATGHVILWDIKKEGDQSRIETLCRAILEGGHESSRPLFGASFFGGDEQDLLLTWGVDGRLVLWDSYWRGQIRAPLGTLVNNPDYPIYSVGLFESQDANVSSVIVTCGGRETSFIGVPFSLYNIPSLTNKQA